MEALRTMAALRMTPPVKPDVMPPTYLDGRAVHKGFIALGLCDCPRVNPACTTYSNHAVGSDLETRSQGSKPLFSTKVLALRALRNECEQLFAKRLRNIDLMIEKEGGRPW